MMNCPWQTLTESWIEHEEGKGYVEKQSVTFLPCLRDNCPYYKSEYKVSQMIVLQGCRRVSK